MRTISALPPLEVVDEVELPQRPRGIERPAREPAHQRLQLLRARAARQRHAHDVMRRCRNRGAFSQYATPGPAPAAAESARKRRKRSLDDPLDAREADALGEDQHAA